MCTRTCAFGVANTDLHHSTAATCSLHPDVVERYRLPHMRCSCEQQHSCLSDASRRAYRRLMSATCQILSHGTHSARVLLCRSVPLNIIAGRHCVRLGVWLDFILAWDAFSRHGAEEPLRKRLRASLTRRTAFTHAHWITPHATTTRKHRTNAYRGYQSVLRGNGRHAARFARLASARFATDAAGETLVAVEPLWLNVDCSSRIRGDTAMPWGWRWTFNRLSVTFLTLKHDKRILLVCLQARVFCTVRITYRAVAMLFPIFC